MEKCNVHGGFRSVNDRRKFYRGAVLLFALEVGFGVLPVMAGQDEPDQVGVPAQGSEENSAQADTPQEPPPSYQQVPSTLTLPAGTVITVRVSQWLSSDQNQPGESFSAELQQPLVADGWVVARRGQTVIGRVVVAQKAGRVKGVSQLGLELTRLILVDGQQVAIRTQLRKSSGGTSQARDVQAIGTATGIGAVIGAAARGGQGAGIGAAIGAATGVAGVLLTRGRPTLIPPETVLTFEIQKPVTFSTDRSRVAFRPAIPEDFGEGGLRRRTPRFTSAPYPPAPYYYCWDCYPRPYFYASPFFIGFYGFGRFRHFRR